MKTDAAMWVVIYMARGTTQADEVEKLLSKEGFLVRRKLVSGQETQPDCAFEIMVLHSEAREAQTVLMDNNL